MKFKIFWAIRGLIYKPFFGRYSLPSYFGKPVYIRNFKRIFIGRRVRIYPNARIEALGENSSITIEENVSIGQGLHLTVSGELTIGKNTTISGNVLITDTEHTHEEIDSHIMNQKQFIKCTKIGDNCFIGYGAAIQAGTILGKQCIIGTNSVVRGNFPDYSVIVGAPAKIVKRYNESTKSWEKTDAKGAFILEA